MKYVFGPVNSRRLGVSLGIDIVPFKTCSFNCIYCECGATTELTDEVKEYVPYDAIVSEIRQVLNNRPEVDIITFSGSGEPTLNSRIGDIINFIKNGYPMYKVAVLTNSCLLHRLDVRERLLEADIIYPSLDAVSENTFNKIMRPLPGVDPEVIIDSLVKLRNEFKGMICLEIFIVAGVNDGDEELFKLKEACIKINPDEIHLNHLDRPGAEDWVKPADMGKMEMVKDFFKPLPVRLIERVKDSSRVSDYSSAYNNAVLHGIKEKGSTPDELSELLNMRLFDVLKALKNLKKNGKVKKISDGKIISYIKISAG